MVYGPKVRYVSDNTKFVVVALAIFALAFMVSYSIFENQGRYRRYRGYGHYNMLKQLGTTMAMYSSDMFYGTMPETLDDLRHVDNQYVSRYLSSVYREGSVDGDWQFNQLHYLYEGGANPDDIPPGAPVIIYSYPNMNGITYIVLYMDSHVRSFHKMSDAFAIDRSY